MSLPTAVQLSSEMSGGCLFKHSPYRSTSDFGISKAIFGSVRSNPALQLLSNRFRSFNHSHHPLSAMEAKVTNEQLNRPVDLTTLSSSYISKPVHDEIILYFSGLPLDTRTEVDIMADFSYSPRVRRVDPVRQSNDYFFDSYVDAFCGRLENAFQFPPQLRQSVEALLLFYIRELDPYFRQFRRNAIRPVPVKPWKLDPSTVYIDLAVQLGNLRYPECRIFHQRWTSGLCRPAQFQLIDVTLRRLIVRLSAALHGDFPQESERCSEISRLSNRATVMLFAFLISPCFRSERIELLLLRYVLDDEVNQQVVDGLEAAQRHVENLPNESIAHTLNEFGQLEYSGWFDGS
ncbi:hypothetical protein BJ508DRAFT_379542 [Ascobolus immersus RN42]|uniref:Uncharacterized protein n=1 Tax=Ascobolus immersus RN42 TaxID=1160509 RepID=A0A3N4I383_ASCIM|nr:hypothetical protein BJ508DRAFT_379542 [Ascobolus immersus RN42]